MQRRLAGSLVVALAVCLPFFGNPSPVSAEVRYTVTDLSAIWEAANPAISEAFTYFIPRSTSLNDQGQVVGAYWLNAENPQLFGVEYGFVWDPSSGLHEFGRDTYMTAINEQGLAVGATLSGPFSWDCDSGRQTFPMAGGIEHIEDVNDFGVAVGYSYSTTPGVRTAFVWDAANGSRNLGTFGADSACALGINNQGQILGAAIYQQHDEHEDFWFVWDPNTGMHCLGNRNDTQFIAINDLGQVAGSGYRLASGSDASSSTHNTLLRWQDGEMTELETLSNGSMLVGGANNVGEIVGAASDWSDGSHDNYAFLWNENDGLQDLNDLIATDSPWRVTWANDINNRGEVLCRAFDGEGHERILMLTPVPEPLPLASLLGGVVMLLARFVFLKSMKER